MVAQVESTAIEAIHRPLEADISNVAYLEYTLEGVNADWTVNVNRCSISLHPSPLDRNARE
eukprot:423457-Rhodomonas_salina.1